MSVRARWVAACALASVFSLGVASLVAAHVIKQVGPYSVAIGWVKEPTYVGEQNAVQVVVKDANGNPVDDLSPDDMTVVISTAGQQSDPMSLAPTYDEDTGLGIPGDYEAPVIPTSPGDYTFHVSGTIHGTAIDETVTSSESTFDAVVQPTGIQFPDQLPAMGDVVTRIDRVDARAGTAASSADDASARATLAIVVGAVVGGMGILVALVALLVAWRRPRPTGS
jgi:hypothetical protein